MSELSEPLIRPFIGRYQLIRKIAVGGMAEIYLARVSGIGGFEKNVVLKRILPQLAQSEEFFRMFLDEARIAASLQHPNIVQIYDAGHEGGQYYIAMEYLDGADVQTIRRMLKEKKRMMPIEHALHIGISVAAGLHYAHEKLDNKGKPLGIVHRDVTPQNVFLTRDGSVKLVDFGIAKASNRLSQTSYGTLKGKLAYMSPEQCLGEETDRRSDIYSLGILLYELTTGRRLYSGKSEYTTLKEIVEGSVPFPSTLVADYPSELESLIMRSLRKSPEARFESARELQQELERYSRSRQIPVSPLGMGQFLEPLLLETARRAKVREAELAREAGAAIPMPLMPEDSGGVEELGVESESLDGLDVLVEQIGSQRFQTPDPVKSELEAVAKRAKRPTRKVLPPVPEIEPVAVPPAQPLPDFHDPSLENVRLGRRTAPFILAALFLGLVGLGGFFYMTTRTKPAAEKVAPEPVPIPERGAITVSSTPAGAEVWLMVGRSPVATPPVDSSAVHWIRIEYDGYAPKLVRVAGDSWNRDGETPVAPLVAELSPERADESEPDGKEAEEELEEPGAASPGVIEISSEPSSARVWLLVGKTPTTIYDVSTSARHQLRITDGENPPAFIAIGKESFGNDGNAEVKAALGPQ